MYRITLITVGTLKESFWREAYQEYAKRLGPYARFECIEVAEESFRSQGEVERVLTKEGAAVLARIPEGAYVIACDVVGKSMDSVRLADHLKVQGEAGTQLVFVIGGALGLSDEIRQRAQLCLTLSPLTFTHQLARIILLEQLYRAMTIIHGKAYHY